MVWSTKMRRGGYGRRCWITVASRRGWHVGRRPDEGGKQLGQICLRQADRSRSVGLASVATGGEIDIQRRKRPPAVVVVGEQRAGSKG